MARSSAMVSACVVMPKPKAQAGRGLGLVGDFKHDFRSHGAMMRRGRRTVKSAPQRACWKRSAAAVSATLTRLLDDHVHQRNPPPEAISLGQHFDAMAAGREVAPAWWRKKPTLGQCGSLRSGQVVRTYSAPVP